MSKKKVKPKGSKAMTVAKKKVAKSLRGKETVGLVDWIANFKKFIEFMKKIGPIFDVLIPLIDSLIAILGTKQAVANWGKELVAAHQKQLVSKGNLRQRLLEVPKQ